ncbi:MAG: hypothetical protein JO013_02520 [Alphaproteobacteria bacterium]|nr:hypothetical protein [Alphaproteobacteria bacterium]
MWQWAVLGLLAVVPAPTATATFGGESFGRQRAMTCRWFSNFENSRFDRCTAGGSDVLGRGEAASVACTGKLCDALDAEARRVAHWRSLEPVWGSFTVRIVGRVALTPHTPRYRGDGTRTVLVERLLSVSRTP